MKKIIHRMIERGGTALWQCIRRAETGTVNLFRYLDERAFRFNERKDCDAGRFLKLALSISGKRLTYFDLTDGKGGERLPPQTAGA
jgi:hypothetical protein